MPNISSSFELELFPKENKPTSQDYSSTFADNMTLPIHKWFRYTAGFSAAWVKEVIKEQKAKGRTKIIEPFAGSGTVLLECELQNVESIGIEAHPYIFKIAKTKLAWSYDPEKFKKNSLFLLEQAKTKSIRKRTFSCKLPQNSTIQD